MTPAARLSAAIAVLDRVLGGEHAELALTNWGRASRFAGSGDRAAVRDLVFEALRCRRSFAALGGAETGRGLILGGLRAQGADPADFFTGQGHAPAPLGSGDVGALPKGAAAMDLPDWLWPMFQASLGDRAEEVALALRRRAPVFLRVNLARASRDQAIAVLAQEGIAAVPHPLARTALEITEGHRRIQTSMAYMDGLVELQDAASQAVVEALPLKDRMRVLDFCAGGGGKTLAMAGLARLSLVAHDASPRRMKDLPDRAKRAGVKVILCERPEAKAPYDLVLADVPCSGSGSWRRDPQGKWAIGPEKLSELQKIQSDILDRIAPLVAADGTLAYATCSLLRAENHDQIRKFTERNPGWALQNQRQFTPLDDGDGFYVAILNRV